MSDIGIKLTKPGFKVQDADPKDLVMGSHLNSLKLLAQGQANISVSAYTGFGGTGVGQTDITHNLGLQPFFLSYFKLIDQNRIWLQDSIDTSVVPNNFITGRTWSDTTKIRMRVTVTGNDRAGFIAVGYYFIFADKGML